MNEPELQPGSVVADRFILARLIGKGAFGTVWEAQDMNNGDARVALKLLIPRVASDKKTVQRFVQEAKILERLEHPSIARPIAWSGEPPTPYLAMEYVDGETLHDVLQWRSKVKDRYTNEEVTFLAENLASALDLAHSNQIIHRDLKPKNVMVAPKHAAPFVKVLDFGIAKLLEGSEVDPTTMGKVLGSLFYVSPDQLRKQNVDHRSDVFALGTILFEVLTLKRAWARDEFNQPLPWDVDSGPGEMNSHVAVLRRIAREPRPLVSRERRDVSPSVDQVIGRAMAVSADDRYASAGELVRALIAALAEPPPPPSPAPPARGGIIPSFKKK